MKIFVIIFICLILLGGVFLFIQNNNSFNEETNEIINNYKMEKGYHRYRYQLTPTEQVEGYSDGV